jgi:hypothetical protein
MTERIPEPKIGRPKMPDGYGVPETDEHLLPWSYVVDHMTLAHNYWITTATPEGKPAATPVWGVWMDGKLYFDGAPSTRRGRNIRANPQTVVHLESGDEVVILEGETIILNSAPERGLAERLSAAITAKYGEAGYSPQPDQWDQGGLFVFQPEMGMGWSKFPENVTRWQIR